MYLFLFFFFSSSKSDPSRRPLPGPSIVPYTLRQVLEGNVQDDHFIALCPMVKVSVKIDDSFMCVGVNVS